MTYKTLKDFNFQGKRVLVRLDMDIPVNDKGEIQDDFRLKKAIPTINYLKDNGAAQIILIGHLGRPKNNEQSLTTNAVAERFRQLLSEDILKLDDCVDIEIPNYKRIVILENLRFHKEEEKNDDNFAKKLSKHADLFVLEAFAVSHRSHSSITGIQKYLPSCAGLQLEHEIEKLDISHDEKPIVAILGAAKVSDKIKLISKLLEKVDYLLIGGAIEFTFFKAEGLEVGKSLVDESSIPIVNALLKNPKIILPSDVVVADKISEDAKYFTVKNTEMPKDYIGLDIGERTIWEYKNILSKAKTIIWNGPLGKFETKPFDKATREIAEYITTLDAISIIGGGDTANAMQQFGLESGFTHVSTGGGASLELLQGEKLPGIVALEENSKTFN